MKTPLTFGEGSDREWYIYDADENWIAEAVPSEPGEAEKTARRIVACVNACEGLPAGTIDGGWTAAGMSAYARKLEDALNEILILPTERIAKAYVIAGAALALRHNAPHQPGAEAVEEADGTWVRYEDALAAVAAERERWEAVVFDGWRVLKGLDEAAAKRTTHQNVSDTLDALMRVLRA